MQKKKNYALDAFSHVTKMQYIGCVWENVMSVFYTLATPCTSLVQGHSGVYSVRLVPVLYTMSSTCCSQILFKAIYYIFQVLSTSSGLTYVLLNDKLSSHVARKKEEQK